MKNKIHKALLISLSLTGMLCITAVRGDSYEIEILLEDELSELDAIPDAVDGVLPKKSAFIKDNRPPVKKMSKHDFLGKSPKASTTSTSQDTQPSASLWYVVIQRKISENLTRCFDFLSAWFNGSE